MDQLALSNYITITKIFRFEMAHALHNHDGPCQNLHGHSYKLHVGLAGRVKNEPGAPDDGMLMDFSQLKEMVHQRIINLSSINSLGFRPLRNSEFRLQIRPV